MGNETTIVDETEPLVGSYRTSESDAELSNDGVDNPKAGVGLGFFLVAMLGAFIAYADDSFMVSTHGEIASQFGQLALGPWLMAAYNLGYVVALPMYGRICDMFGYKKPLLSAYLIFSIGCLIAGGANSIWMIIAGRFLSGAGGAGMVDLISVILNDMETLREVAMLRSYLGMVTTAGVSAGAPLGGLIVDKLGWRWSFLIQAPLGLLCFGFTFWAFRSGSRLQQLEENERSNLNVHGRKLNLVGLILLAGTLASIMVLCQILGNESLSVRVIVGVVGAVVGFALLFGINEKFLTSDPLIPLKLFGTNKIGVIYLIQFLVHFAFFGMVSNITDFWIRTQNISNGLAGTFAIPVAVGALVGATIQGQSIRRTGKYKVLSLVSWLVGAVGYALMLVRWPMGPSRWENMYPFIASIGICGFLVGQYVGLSAVLPAEMKAMTMTVYFMSQQLGIMFGVTVNSTASRKILQKCLLHDLDGTPSFRDVIHKVMSDNRYSSWLSEPYQKIIRSCFLQGYRAVPTIGLSTLVLVFPMLVYLPENSLDA
ncbi:transporter [Penicillium taxi]|uniref:transporter n=1 Tax=Penicillium taxi TaxID=168475 RepID=UPI0025453316|nr:transporter [Penicillium taxi]KAJ5902903.1 transporter [Penicillium taxi]